MDRDVHIIRRVLRTTALCGVLAVLATPAFAQTFDPNATTDSSGTALADASSFDPAAIPPTPAEKPISKTIETTLTTGTQRLGGEPMSLLSANAAAAAPSTGTAPPPVPPFASVIPSPILSPMASSGVPLAGVHGNPSEDPEVPQDPKTVFVAPAVIPPAKPVVIAQPAAVAPAPLALSQPIAGQPVALESPVVAAPVVAAPTVIAAPPAPLVPEAKPVVVAQPAPVFVAPKPVVVAEPAVVPPAPPAPVVAAAKPIAPVQSPVIAEAAHIAPSAPKPIALAQPPVVAEPPVVVAKPVPQEPPAPKPPEQPPVVVAKPAVAEAPVLVAKQTSIEPKPHFPPVDPAVSAQAEREMKVKPAAYIAPLPTFSAPAPLTKQEPAPAVVAPVAAAPVAVKQVAVAPAPAAPAAVSPVFVKPAAPAPVAPSASIGAVAPEATAPSVGAAAPQTATEASSSTAEPPLSADSKAILRKLPTRLNNMKPAAGGKLNVSRMSPDVKPLNEDKDKIQSYDAVGLSIKVARPGLDTNFELNRAYTALMGGDTETAIATYKNILTSEPQNQDALFGLAATYHRTGQLDKARPYYGQLLKVNPTHREGLNNFLALVSEESPNEALVELERLEQNNPDFSPIPAQEAMVFSKLGYFDQARDKLLRAIELAPDNMTYKYNLAILFDRHGDHTNAAALYRLLIDASLKGEKLPASTDTLQTRLNYITAASAPH